MNVHGFQKMTLLDYPGKVACTIFTAGCQFRCPFCHNARLVTQCRPEERIETDEILSYLKKRRGLLDGVCITGGEPTLQRDLADFIRELRGMGYAVKLDTNGSDPVTLSSLIEQRLLDYVAMDVKNTPEKYALTVGLADFDLAPVEQSIRLLRQGKVEHEFRTTVVRELHTPQDVAAIAASLAPDSRYFLQPFVDSGELIGQGLHAPDAQTLEQMLSLARQILPQTAIRGA